MGYVTRDQLKSVIGESYRSNFYLIFMILVTDHLPEEQRSRKCVFSPRFTHTPEESINLSGVLEQSIMQIRKEVPEEIVVKMFQKLVGFH